MGIVEFFTELGEEISDGWKIAKLRSYKNDLDNDSLSIRIYNEKIDSAISNYQKFIRTGNAVVVDRLDDYREPQQGNDSNLSNARTYIQREINRLDD